MPKVNWEEIKADAPALSKGFDPWPRGSKTRCMIERVTHENRPGQGKCFSVGFRAVEGEREGQWAWLNAWTERSSGKDTDEQTAKIGIRKIGALYDALGLPLFGDTADINTDDTLASLVTVLSGKPNRWMSRQGENKITTEIVGFESAVPQAPPAVVAAPVAAVADDGSVF